MTRRTFATFLLGLIVAADARSDSFQILQNRPLSPQIPINSTPIIVPEAGATLSPAPSPMPLNPGELLLRRRFGESDYGYYIGKPDPSGFALLSAFRPPDASDVYSFRFFKFYRRREFNPSLDIVDMYFDNDYIYAENASRLFYHDKEWRTIEMQRFLPTRLSVYSQPSDAAVTINDRYFGQTPIHLINPPSSVALIHIAKKGYCTRTVLAFPTAGTHSTVKRRLTPALPPNAWVSALQHPEAIALLDIVEAIEKLRTSLRRGRRIDESSSIGEGINYQDLRASGEFEDSSTLNKRAVLQRTLRKALHDVAAARDRVNRTRIKMLLLDLCMLRTRLETRDRYHLFSTAVIRLGRYQASRRRFPIMLRVDEAGHRFTLEGSVLVPLPNAFSLSDSAALSIESHSSVGQSLQLKAGFRYRVVLDRMPPFHHCLYYSYRRLSLISGDSEFPIHGSLCYSPGPQSPSAPGNQPRQKCGAIVVHRGE